MTAAWKAKWTELSYAEMSEKIADEATQEVDAKLASNAEYQASNEAKKQLIRWEAIRRLVTEKTQSLLKNLQIKVDKEFDIRLSRAMSKMWELSIPLDQQKEIMKRFKAEMYVYMSKMSSTTIKTTYTWAENDEETLVKDHIQSNLSYKRWFEVDIQNILEKIAKDMKTELWMEVDFSWMNRFKEGIINEFNQ